MTAAALIALLQMFRAPSGGFGQFTNEKLRHKNDTVCVAIH